MSDVFAAPSDEVDRTARTPEFPRGFNGKEFWRGAFFAWAAFQPIGIALLTWSGQAWAATVSLVELIATATYFWVIGGVITTALVTLLGLPLAHVIGRMLRRVPNDWIHVAAFSAYGFLIGYVMMWALNLPDGESPGSFGLWSPPVTGLGAGAAVALGWLITSRIALVADRKRAVSR